MISLIRHGSAYGGAGGAGGNLKGVGLGGGSFGILCAASATMIVRRRQPDRGYEKG